jgi:flagellar biosynthesis anti-sigma factor FlgM
MQIRETNAAVIARTYTRQTGGVGDSSAAAGASPGANAQRRARTDSLAFSSTFQQISCLQEQVAGEPDVRADKVAGLRAQIAAGTYQVDTTALAQHLLGVQ